MGGADEVLHLGDELVEADIGEVELQQTVVVLGLNDEDEVLHLCDETEVENIVDEFDDIEYADIDEVVDELTIVTHTLWDTTDDDVECVVLKRVQTLRTVVDDEVVLDVVTMHETEQTEL